MIRDFSFPGWAWILLATLLILQAAWIFRDAKHRGYNPWLWGALGLLNVPSSLIIYLLLVNYRNRDGKGETRHVRS